MNGGVKYFPNEYCTLTEETNAKRTALTKIDATGKKPILIIDSREGVWGIMPPRPRAAFSASMALLDDRVKLVTQMGAAGALAKTLMATAAGLKKTVLHPGVPLAGRGAPDGGMGKELGFFAWLEGWGAGALDAANP